MAERPEDLNLPNAVVTRIIKEAIPEGINVSKEARLAISKAASVFVLYATSCSNNFALKGKRKTINATDVISAMEDMEFEQFVDPLKECLDVFRNEQKGKREASQQRKKDREQSNNSTLDGSNLDLTVEDDDEEEKVNNNSKNIEPEKTDSDIMIINDESESNSEKDVEEG
ncbi:hypothetical protein LOTGIDRAFT_238643 [Lottia gigantea]|uniref:DNA polymerase epsilon subunit 3 n=1 Tax=Lottia gigantea TaxID=225164 RepID=V4CE76_LOTGI|nr:hypothetical protein LOTGIDRAFT_238643 [Lottia gigantea]ESP00265.1 hypothetical protein LOTGIDRAFT_238643 [Lottia gigantea]